MGSTFWDDRYRVADYAYGTEPNRFFKEQISRLEPDRGPLLFVAEGEGRNAVYAATLGFEAYAFDTSVEGQRKAFALAETQGVALRYERGDARTISYPLGFFQGIVLIFAHMPEPFRRTVHQRLLHFLAPDGIVLLEGFSRAHAVHQAVNPEAGGPLEVDRLFARADIEEDFRSLEPVVLTEVEEVLSEGVYHRGPASLLRFVGVRPH